jgi:hypothetical protein
MKKLACGMAATVLTVLGLATTASAGTLAPTRSDGRARVPAVPTVLAGVCGADEVLTPFEMPIYDDEGWFVVGWETVWYCVDEDLEPAG